MPPLDLQDLDWGSVPAWLGAGSLLLAFRVFLRDRTNAERAQVDLVGAWLEPSHEAATGDETDKREGARLQISVSNASELPIEVERIDFEVQTFWYVRSIETPGVESYTGSFRHINVMPKYTQNFFAQISVAHMAPEGAETLADATGKITSLLIIDNAGRRWQVQPGKRGRARQVRSRFRAETA